MFKETSLRYRLTFNSIIIYFFIWLSTAAIVYYNEFKNLDDYMHFEIQDVVYSSIYEDVVSWGQETPNNKDALYKLASIWEKELFEIQVWHNGKRVFTTDDTEKLPIPEFSGYLEMEDYAVYHHEFKEQGVNIVVPIWELDTIDLFLTIIGQTFVPFLLLLPLACIALYVGIDVALKPLNRVSQAIEEKSANNLDAIPVNNIPKEIWPIVNSLNLLLKQIDNSLESERNFTANAAHELLTPLAAIKTEVQLLLRQNQTPQGSAPIDYSTSLLEINSRLDRATHTVEQLVLLSRYDSENQNGDIDNQATNIRDLVQEEISALGGKIEEKAIAFSFVEHPLTPEANNKDFVFEGNKIALQILCRNLFDNAVRYTPEAGYINISISRFDHEIVLEISNSAEIISKLLSSRLFKRFVRGPGVSELGSGLGLSIAQQIVKQHHAELAIDASPDKKEFQVRLKLPINH